MKFLLIAVLFTMAAAEGCGKDTYDAFYCFTNKAFCDVPANEKWMSANCAGTCCKAAPSAEKVYVRQPGDNTLCGTTLQAAGCAESENIRQLCPGLCGNTAAWRTPVENTAPVVGKPVVPEVPPLPPKPTRESAARRDPDDDPACGGEYPFSYCALSAYIQKICPGMCGPKPPPTPKPAAPTPKPAAPTPKPAAPTPKPAAPRPVAAPTRVSDDRNCADYPVSYCESSAYIMSICPVMCSAIPAPPAVADDAPAVADDAPAAAPGASPAAAGANVPAGAPGASAGAYVPAGAPGSR